MSNLTRLFNNLTQQALKSTSRTPVRALITAGEADKLVPNATSQAKTQGKETALQKPHQEASKQGKSLSTMVHDASRSAATGKSPLPTAELLNAQGEPATFGDILKFAELHGLTATVSQGIAVKQGVKQPTIEISSDNIPELMARGLLSHDPRDQSVGIVHIGGGNFVRSHQAEYVHDLQSLGFMKDMSMHMFMFQPMDKALVATANKQGNLYTLNSRGAQGEFLKVISSLKEVTFAPDHIAEFHKSLAAPSTKAVTITVTEGGYGRDEATGRLDMNHPEIQHYLKTGEAQGWRLNLALGLIKRMESHGAPMDIMSCDNVQGNGEITHTVMKDIVDLVLKNPKLSAWMDKNVIFRTTMVDRITPGTTDKIRNLTQAHGISDQWAVAAEPFKQWVVDNESKVGFFTKSVLGVQATKDVMNYENQKLHLLNGSHAIIAYLGKASGYNFVHEVMENPRFRAIIARFMRNVQQTLHNPEVNLDDYCKQLMERFSNPLMEDRLDRIANDGAAKMPKFVFGTVRDALEKGVGVEYLALNTAGWLHYLRGAKDDGSSFEPLDPQMDSLKAFMNGGDVTKLLENTQVFGTDLPKAQHFCNRVKFYANEFAQKGVERAFEAHLGNDITPEF